MSNEAASNHAATKQMATPKTALGSTQDASRYGKLGTTPDDQSYVAFERRLPHTKDKVWRALTDPAELKRWFPEIELEPKPGGKYRIEFGEEGAESTCEGGPAVLSGTIHRFEPGKILQCGGMCWELEALDEQSCILRFTDVINSTWGPGQDPFTNSILGGWHWYMDALERALLGDKVDRSVPEVDYSKVQV
ncbi:MAG: SRPBCC domain-containing protein [Pseudohongiellaceae bacterium]